jgi:hypothetical protein
MNYLSSWKANGHDFLDAVFPLSLSIDDISNHTRRHSSNSSPTSSNVAKTPTVARRHEIPSSPWFSDLTRGLNANLKSSNRTRITRLLPSSDSPSPATTASGPKARGNKDGRLLDDGNTGPVHAPRQTQEDVHGENLAGMLNIYTSHFVKLIF